MKNRILEKERKVNMKTFGMVVVAALGAAAWAKEPAPEVTVRVDPSASIRPR